VNSTEGNAQNFDQTLDVAYPLTYYPDATETDSATPIQLHGGESSRVDFHLTPVPALRVIFRVPGDSSRGWPSPLLERPAFDGLTEVQTSMNMVSPGLFEVSGIPAGRYNVRIQGEGVNLAMNEVEFSKNGEQIDASEAEPLGTLKVSIHLKGQGKIPAGMAVGLRSASHRPVTWFAADEKGNAEVQQIAAGKYDVLIVGARQLYSVSSMSAEGAQVSGHTLTIAVGTTASISLTAATGAVEIRGTAKRAGKDFAGAMVVLVPKDPENNRDLFRRDQSDLDGTFSLRGVVPGSYTLVAIEDGWDLDWARPEIIAAYAKHGQSIEIHAETSSPVRTREAVEVQSK
jgi:hypothetical protein